GRRAQLDRLVLQGRSRLAGPVATLDAGRPETRENLPGEPISDLAVVMHFAVEAVDGIDAELVADGPVALARTSGKRIAHFADERRGVRLDRGDETADLAPAGLRGGHRIGAPFVHRPRLVEPAERVDVDVEVSPGEDHSMGELVVRDRGVVGEIGARALTEDHRIEPTGE